MAKDPYLKVAGKYDKRIEPFNRGLRKIGLWFAPAKKDARVLDFGCGTGSHLDIYFQKGSRVFGIDASSAMLAQAKKKLSGKAHLVKGDGSRAPFPDNSFDIVILSLILHETHPVTREKIFGEAIRVTGEQGRILVIEYHPGMKKSIKGITRKTLILFIEKMAGKEHNKNYRHFVKNGALGSLVKNHNVKIEKEKIVAGGNVGVYLLAKEKQQLPLT